MLHRDFNTVDGVGPAEAGVHFVAPQAFSVYLPYMRHAMNGVDFDTGIIGQPRGERGPGFAHEGEVDVERNGIIEHLETKRRGNYIVPAITLRALPPARALRPDVSVEEGDGEYRVTLEDREFGGRIDEESGRSGYYRAVNGGGGAPPEHVSRCRGRVTVVFDAAEGFSRRNSTGAPPGVGSTPSGGTTAIPCSRPPRSATDPATLAAAPTTLASDPAAVRTTPGTRATPAGGCSRLRRPTTSSDPTHRTPLFGRSVLDGSRSRLLDPVGDVRIRTTANAWI